jgi:hypothetical protein
MATLLVDIQSHPQGHASSPPPFLCSAEVEKHKGQAWYTNPAVS